MLRNLLCGVLGVLCLGASTFSSAQNLPDYVPTEGLLGWYGFDGNALDASSHERHGTITNAIATANRNSLEGMALLFGEDLGEDPSRVSIPGLVQDVTDDFTYSFWTLPDSLTPNLPSQGGSGTEGNVWQYIIHPIHGHQFGTDSLHAGAGVYVGKNGIAVLEHSDAFQACPLVHELDVIDWIHVTITYAEGIPSLYVNGVFVKTGVATERLTHISLGTDVWYPQGGIGNGYAEIQFEGKIDDLGFWSRALEASEISSLFVVWGCTDETACNFSSAATSDDGSCQYCQCGIGQTWSEELGDCVALENICGEGTHWDSETGQCVAQMDCAEDLDDDGIIGVNDLMQLLSTYGTDCPDAAAWTCGNPLSYQGYDYQTIAIGEQCWFAENLRSEAYANGDAIQSELNDSEWQGTSSGALSIYGQGNSSCFELHPDGNPCDPIWSLEQFGRLYNGYAVNDPRGLCPIGWQVPTDEDWKTMELQLGMLESEVNSLGWRGTNEGSQLKTSDGWLNNGGGDNSVGFNGKSGGIRDWEGNFGYAGDDGRWWSIYEAGYGGMNRYLNANYDLIYRGESDLRTGLSVRCIQN